MRIGVRMEMPEGWRILKDHSDHSSGISYLSEALDLMKEMAEALEQAEGAFTHNWAIDWNDITKVLQKFREWK